jgi:anti-sigma regulatory factor (Ser/Thr protein kinase)
MTLYRSYLINEPSGVGNLRRAVNLRARQTGFNQELRGRAALVATEMATNLIKHTPSGGEVLVGTLRAPYPQQPDREINGLCLIALDQGPGLVDPYYALRNGVSTAGTLGGGLGAIQRMSDQFDIQTSLGKGTAILAQIWDLDHDSGLPTSPWEIEIGAVTVARPGQKECGDGWLAVGPPNRPRILVVDGLGHGEKAAEAKQAALDTFRTIAHLPPETIIKQLNEALRRTRGAVLALVEIDLTHSELKYTSIGNIAGRLLSPERDHGLIAFGGIVGSQIPRIQLMSHAWSSQRLLIMHTDGLKTQWDISDYAGLVSHHPTLVAAVLYRDFSRRTDDIAVVVARS